MTSTDGTGRRDESRRPNSLDEQLCFALFAATNALVRAYRPRLEALGITYPQYLVLLALWQDGPRSVADLAERLVLPAGAIAPLVRRLETAGFVETAKASGVAGPDLIALTGRGAALEARIVATRQDLTCETGLDPVDIALLREELKAVAERMRARRET